MLSSADDTAPVAARSRELQKKALQEYVTGNYAMKLVLISPTFRNPDGSLYKRQGRELVPMTLPYLAALTPKDVQVSILDECLEDVNYNIDCDLVGISFMSHQAPRAYQIADSFRARGKRVVMGGFHASLCPEEALLHSDSVVIGEAEAVWEQLLHDFQHRRLQQIYRAESFHDLKGLPAPRLDLVDLRKYRSHLHIPLYRPVQTSRGCPYHCSFCEVAALNGGTYRFRPIADIVDEIRESGSENIYFVDDNIAANRNRALELFRALRPLRLRRWTGLCNLLVARDEELLDAMKESGCVHLNIGLESISQASLREMKKNALNRVEQYHECFRALRKKGIHFSLNIVFGFDSDDPAIFDTTIRFLIKERVHMAVFFILTPRVGTPIRRELEREGRILHSDWAEYGGWHCVFTPKQMSPEMLEDSFWKSYRRFYSLSSILTRLVPLNLKCLRSDFMYLLANLCFNRALQRGVHPVLFM